MTMMTKTADEILKTTCDYHQSLASSLDQGAYLISDERAGLLLNYLANQESKLSSTVKTIRHEIGDKEKNTWFYEYSDRHQILHEDPREIMFSEMKTDEIQSSIAKIHNELIDLYEHMYERSESNTIKEYMGNIVDMYKSATNQISYSAETVNEL